MRGHSLSLRVMFAVGALAAVLVLSIVTGLALWGVSSAQNSVARAQHSYDELALVTRVEADIGRLLIQQIKRIVDPTHQPSSGAQAQAQINAALDQLIVQIRDEIKSLDDKDEQAAEQEELQTAFALKALFNNMMTGISRERAHAGAVDTDNAIRTFMSNVVAADFAQLNEIVQSVAADERTEVRNAIDSMDALNLKLTILVGAILAVSTILAFAGAAGAYRSLMRPLSNLTEGAAALADGNLSHRIAERGPREFVCLAINFNDMADRISTHQSTLKRINEKLEAAVADRTRQLESKARQLAEIDRSRRLFFSKVSHELRTPLTVLLGDAELALRRSNADASTYRCALKHIAAQGTFMKRRICDLIDLVRSEDGKLVLEKSQFALDTLIRETAYDAKAYASSNEVALQIDVPDHSVMFTGDKSWFRQGVLSLIDNAIKFSPPKSSVRLVLERRSSAAVISVEDEGPGVPNNDLPKLFDPYYQASEGRRRGGTGLGLAVGRWVAQHHGGRISAKNVSSGGLRVSMEIPLVS